MERTYEVVIPIVTPLVTPQYLFSTAMRGSYYTSAVVA